MDHRDPSFDDVCMHADACAITGAAAFFAGIPDAAIVINGPLWCYFFAMRRMEQSESSISHRMVCTQLDNDAIVFGAEACLCETLASYVETPPALLAIVSSCAAGLIGDDVEAIARGIGISCPIVVVDSSGLTGTFADGWAKAAESIVRAPFFASEKTKAGGVRLLGMTSSYYNGENDTRELCRLLNLAGYEVQGVLGGGMNVAAISHMGGAALNIVIHEELGMESAHLLAERCGTPYIAPPLPYGRAGTRRWLKEIGRVLPAPRAADAEAEIARCVREDFLRVSECKSIWGELRFEKALIRAHGSVAWGVAEALRTEWADVVHLAVVADAKAKMPHMADEVLCKEDGGRVREILCSMEDGLLLASSNESAHIDPRKTQYVPIDHPVLDALQLTQSPFMGLRGARCIEEMLWNGNIWKRKMAAFQRGVDERGSLFG